MRLGLLVGWAVALAAFAGLGAHPGDVAALRAGVASGQVQSVTVTPGLSGTGYAVQEVTWRRWGLLRTAEVLQVSPGQQVPAETRARVQTEGPTEIGADLQQVDPTLQVLRQEGATSTYSVLGSRVPGWVAGLHLALLLTTWLLVVSGPPPWRATRWAWFWVLLVPVAGPVAVALLSGPVTGLRRWPPAPRPGRRPLTGGRAALVVLVLMSIVT